MVAIVTIAFIAIITLASIAMTIVQFRRITPLAFLCQKCGHEFHQAPHRDYPRKCPRCHARDWSMSAP